MPGVLIVTSGKGLANPRTLAELKGVATGYLVRQITVHRSVNDTASGIINAGPDKAGAVHELVAGDWYWEYDTDPGQFTIIDNGVSGARISVSWGPSIGRA